MQDFKKVIIPGMLARGKVTKKDNDFAKRELGLTGAPSTRRQFLENIYSEDDLRSRSFGTFAVKCFACLPLLGFSNI